MYNQLIDIDISHYQNDYLLCHTVVCPLKTIHSLIKNPTIFVVNFNLLFKAQNRK